MTEHPNAKVIRDFYEAFARRDGEAMAAAYHDDAHFTDPVFGPLSGKTAGAMWMMLTERGEDLRVEASGIEADDKTGRAHWEAWYTFSATGRKVHNKIDAEFVFKDGKIAKHVDRFGFYRWTRMALGPVGTLLGWTPFLRRKVSSMAIANLKKYQASRGD
jgi:ketosteroid isomerase-like protein